MKPKQPLTGFKVNSLICEKYWEGFEYTIHFEFNGKKLKYYTLYDADFFHQLKGIEMEQITEMFNSLNNFLMKLREKTLIYLPIYVIGKKIYLLVNRNDFSVVCEYLNKVDQINAKEKINHLLEQFSDANSEDFSEAEVEDIIHKLIANLELDFDISFIEGKKIKTAAKHLKQMQSYFSNNPE